MVRSELMEGGLIRHWSDDGHDLLQVETGHVYREAVDTVPCRYTYRECERAPERKQDQTADGLPNAEVLAEEAYLLAQENRAIIEEVLGV